VIAGDLCGQVLTPRDHRHTKRLSDSRNKRPDSAESQHADASVDASLPTTVPTWACLPDSEPLDRPDTADLKPSGDWNGAGVSGQCEESQAELGAAHGVTVQNMRETGRIRWLIDG
jgi:hypothetical protein